MYECFVCKRPIERLTTGLPDDRVHMEGVSEEGTRNWVWGPVTVHYDCRLQLTTPYDDRIGLGFVAASDAMQYDHSTD
jgi:hypothetical protein